MIKHLILPLLLVVVIGCNSERPSFGDSVDKTTGSLENSDVTATEKFIKTADMRFKVKNVQ